MLVHHQPVVPDTAEYARSSVPGLGRLPVRSLDLYSVEAPCNGGFVLRDDGQVGHLPGGLAGVFLEAVLSHPAGCLGHGRAT